MLNCTLHGNNATVECVHKGTNFLKTMIAVITCIDGTCVFHSLNRVGSKSETIFGVVCNYDTDMYKYSTGWRLMKIWV
jgi:hypothetical protein